MDKDTIVEKLEWFCNRVGGKFQIERRKFTEVYYCVGNFDLHIQTDLTKNSTKHLGISGGHDGSEMFYGIEIHLGEEDELSLEYFGESGIDEMKTRYNTQNDYVLNTNTINIKNAKKIEFIIHKNTLDVFII